MASHIVGAAASFDLGQLNQWVKEQEMTLGPITGIGLGEGQTAGVFDVLGDLVTENWASVSLAVGDQCGLGAGWTLICQGSAYVGGVAMPVCVARRVGAAG